jgi:type IV fimbrial biogenesis protein FimT
MRMARNRSAGLTLIELMIGVGLAAVIATLALPSMGEFVRNIRLASGMSQLYSDLLLARSESIRRNGRVLVCPRASQTSTDCATVIAADTWMNGWLVCYDTDADAACDASTAADPNPVRVRSALSTPLSLNGPAALVAFFPIGNANAAATFTMSGGTSTTRMTTVAPSGAVASSKT